MANKSMKLGVIVALADKTTGEAYEAVILGSTKNKDPKYNRTVQLRVLDDEGKVLTQVTNPFISLRAPFKTGGKVQKELVLSLKEETN